MDAYTISLLLRENGLEVLTRSVPQADGLVLSNMDNTGNTWPSTVAELDLVDPEDDDDERDGDEGNDDEHVRCRPELHSLVFTGVA